ncbi:MAG: NADH-quinone oxidoreductase subunit L [Myxococcales bacterium]|nr:NADH-quinone oxidoreductase subunit L [Myxococcales bacterium]
MPSPEQCLSLAILLPLLGAAFNGLAGHRLPRFLVGIIACATVLGAFVLGLNIFWELQSSPQLEMVKTELFTWIPLASQNMELALRADHLSIVMMLVITGVGFLIHLYSIGYMSHDPGFSRYFAYLNLFTFAMLVLVLGDSLPIMFVGWEGVGLCSYLLIGFWYKDIEKSKAGKKAFVVNRIGDFGFILAMLILFRELGTLEFDGIKQAALAGDISVAVATAVGLLLLLGASGKSAQVPLYVWLPDAMAGPTPVSALIHAATMVTAGVYMAARLNFVFTLSPVAMLTMAAIGALTAFFAATIGLVQNDIKKVLAYSTVSQLGFMFIAAGVGAYAAAVFHVVTHAFFKACLFLGSGSVIHAMSDEQDMREMGGLWRKLPITFATFAIATLAIAGFPFMSGFISKDAILWSAFSADMGTFSGTFAPYAKIIWATGVAAAALTAFYMSRLVFLTFFSGPLRAKPEVASHVHESPWTMTVPLIILALLSIFAGAADWPHVFGGHNSFSAWLAPAVGTGTGVTGDHARTEYILMTVATLIALASFALAFYLYAKKIHPALTRLTEKGFGQWLHERLFEKWHIDELYEVIILKPLEWTSRLVLFEGLDKRVIDGLVNLTGWLGRHLGVLGQLFHNGNIQRYLAIFALAVALLLYGWLTPYQAKTATTLHAPAEAAQSITTTRGK